MHYLRPPLDLNGQSGEVRHSWYSYVSLIVGFVAMLPGGALYTFSLFGPSFQYEFGMTALQVALVASFGQLGSAVSGFPTGLLVNSLGPVIPLSFAGVFMFIGYLMLWLMLLHLINYSFWGILISYGVVGVGTQLVTIAVMASNVKNFVASWRGRVLGIMGLSIGISSTFYGTVFAVGGFQSSIPSFLLFLAIVNLCFCVLGALVVSFPRDKDHIERWRRMMFWRRSRHDVSHVEPLVKEGTKRSTESSDAEVEPVTPSKEVLDDNHDLSPSTALDEKQKDDKHDKDEVDDLKIQEAQSPISKQPLHATWPVKETVLNFQFWLIFSMGFFGTSVGMLFLSVLVGSLHVSHGGSLGGQSLAVIIGTMANAGGRLSVGVFSDAALRWVPRAAWAFPMLGFMAAGLLLCMFVDTPDAVVFASGLVGYGYGGMAGGILPTLTADAFGSQFFSINYGLLQPSYPVGFLVWGQAAGAIYQAFVPQNQVVCIGRFCHFWVLLFLVALLTVAAFCASVLSFLIPSPYSVWKKPLKTTSIELDEHEPSLH